MKKLSLLMILSLVVAENALAVTPIKFNCHDVTQALLEYPALADDKVFFNAIEKCMEDKYTPGSFLGYCDNPNFITALQKIIHLFPRHLKDVYSPAYGRFKEGSPSEYLYTLYRNGNGYTCTSCETASLLFAMYEKSGALPVEKTV